MSLTFEVRGNSTFNEHDELAKSVCLRLQFDLRRNIFGLLLIRQLMSLEPIPVQFCNTRYNARYLILYR